MFFSKPKGPQITDTIFLNENGYKHAVANWMEQNTGGIVAVWFQHDLEKLRKAMPGEAESRIVMAEKLSYTHADDNKPLLFAGHYPLRATETLLYNELGLKQMLFFSHLGMPLFAFFGSEQVKDMMIKMGVDEDEPVSHTMITKAISNAQDKVAAACLADMHAVSEAEWMSVNLQLK